LEGHVFPGANLPFGMAKAVADVDKETQGGFASNDGLSKTMAPYHIGFMVDGSLG
jgi:putative alpha-1,2-mannosidase